MTDLRTAAQRALEYIREVDYPPWDDRQLKKDLETALAEPVQEPVAWGVPNTRPTENQPFMQLLHSTDGCQYPELLVPLYTAPPQRKPLTEEEIKVMWESHRAALPRYLCFARAIERAHGIGGQDE